MAVFTVTKDTSKTFQANVPVAMDVRFDVTTATFSVYIKTFRGGVNVAEQKVRFGTVAVIHFLAGDTIAANAVGSGSIDVTIL